MAKLLKRLGSLALAILMVVSLLPLNVFAETTTEETAAEATETEVKEITCSADLEDAFSTGGTYKVTAAFKMEKAMTVTAPLTIDFNGHTIEVFDTVNYPITISAATVFKDTSENQDGGLSLVCAYTSETQMVRGGGGLTIESGNYSITSEQNASIRAFHLWTNPVTVNGGTITASGAGAATNVMALSIDSKAEVQINGGTITANNTSATTNTYGLRIVNNAKVTMAGGTVTANGVDTSGSKYSYGVYLSGDESAFTIEGGTINQTGTCLRTYTSGSETKTGSAGYGIYVASGSLTIGDTSAETTPTITSENRAVHVASSATTTNFYKGNLKVKADLQEDRVFHNAGTLNMYGGSIGFSNTTTSSTNGIYGVYNDGTYNMYGGTISLKSTGTYLIGCYNRGTFNVRGGSITIDGTKKDTVTAIANKSHASRDVITNVYGGKLTLKNTASGEKTAVILWRGDTKTTYACAVNIHGGALVGPALIAKIGSYTTELNVYAGAFYDNDGTDLSEAVRTSSTYEDISVYYRGEETNAIVTNADLPSAIGYANDTEDLTWAINSFGSNGNSVIGMHGDLNGTAQAEYTYGFTLNMNGHTMSTTDGNVLRTRGPVTVNGDGGLLKSVDTKDAGCSGITCYSDLSLYNVRVEARRGAPVANQKGGDCAEQTIYIDGCTLITHHHYAYSNNLQTSSTQKNIHVTIKDSTLVNPNQHVLGGQGNASSNVDNTFTLIGDVHMYQKATTSNYYKLMTPTEDSAEVTKLNGTHTFVEWDGTKMTGLALWTTNPDTAGHSFDAGEVTEVTCTTDGYTTYTCGGCNETYLTDTVVASGHELTLQPADPATCQKAGTIAYYTCSGCELLFAEDQKTVITDIVDPKKDHDYTGEDGKCVNGCGMTACENGAHTWEEVVAKAATCKEAGYAAHFKCECGVYAVETDGEKVITEWAEIEIAQHETHDDLKGTNQENATCTEAGHKAYWYCSVCEKYYSDEAAANEIDNIETWLAADGDGYIAALDHTYVEAEQNGWISNNDGTHYVTCDRNCGEEKTENCADHEVETEGKKATCTDTGMSKGTYCEVCNYVITAEEEIPALNHAWAEKSDANYTAPTAMTDGYWTLTCGNGCGQVNTVTDEGSRKNVDASVSEELEGAETVEEILAGSTMLHQVEALPENHYLEIKVTAFSDMDGVVTKITYDVTPYDLEMGYVAVLDAAITFHLPVDKNVTSTKAAVFHNDELMGADYEIKVGDNGEKYVEVTSAQFSSYTVDTEYEAATPVAKIGDTEYTDLQAAFDEVQDGDTITLLSDITFTTDNAVVNGSWIDGIVYTGDKSFTVDFGGFTVTDDGCINDYVIYLNNKGEKANEITFQNGTIIAKNGCWATVCVNGSSSLQATVLNLDGMKITNSNDASYSGNLAVRARNMATVNVNGGTVITSDGASYGIAAAASNAVVNINGGATVIQKKSGTSGGNSVFAAVGGTGTMNIYEGAVIESDKYGVHTMTTGTPVVNVYGGTITAPVALKASTNGGAGELATIKVTGGTINGSLENYTDNGVIAVSGGIFNEPVAEAYCAEGYIPTENADGTYGVKEGTYVAQVGETKYESLAEAIAAADGGTVTLLTNVELTEAIVIASGETVTLELNGKTVSGSSSASSNFALITNNGTLTIQDSVGDGKITYVYTGASSNYSFAWGNYTIVNSGSLTVESGTVANTTTLNGHMYSAIDNRSGGIVTINGGTVSCPNYVAIRLFAASATADNKVEINDGTVSGAFTLWPQNATGAADTKATLAINGGTIEGSGTTLYIGDELTDTFTVTKADAVEMTAPEGYEWVDGTLTAITYVAEVDGVQYETLADAIAAANGKTVKLLSDVELTEAIVIASGMDVTIDLAGFTVSYDSTVQGEAMISNKGTLTINDSVGTGEIYYNYTGAADSTYGTGNYTIDNAGTLTVNGGKIYIANLRAHAKYPINNNSTTGDAICVINGGHLYNYNTSAIRQFCNSTTYKNSVTINGGLVEGYCAVWMQNPGSKTVNGSLSITGGEIKTTAAAYVNGTAELKDVASRIYCTTEGGAWSEGSAVSITGGTINENVDLAEEAPAALTCEGATFNGYVTLPAVETGLAGSGTEEDPFQISSLEDLILFRDSVNAGETTYNANGVYVVLTANIDMTGADWSNNIGDAADTSFDGIFDGKGYTISNLTSVETAKDPYGYVCTGLFGCTAGNAVIKNLTIDNANITAAFTGNNASVLVGFGWNWTGSVENVKITNSTLNASAVTGTGAILGYDYYGNVTIKNCSVENTTVIGQSYVGGVVGYGSNKCTVSGTSFTNGTVTANGGCAGGIAGIMLANTTVDGCTVSGATIEAKHENWLNSAASAVGCITSSVTVTNFTTDSTLPVVGCEHADKPTAPVEKVQAAVDNVYYTSLADALAAVTDGCTLELLADVEASEVIMINGSITINGNGHTLTSSASRIFRLANPNMEVTMNELNMVSTAVMVYPNDIRGISFDNACVNTKLTLNNCSVDFTDASASDWSYAINTTDPAEGAVITVNGGSYEGANVINLNAPNAVVTVDGATLTSLYAANAQYCGVCVKTSANATGATIKVTNTTFEGEHAIAFENVSADAALTQENNTDNTKRYVALVDGQYFHTLQEAINAADGKTVTLLNDIVLTEGVTVASGVTVTLDLAGCDITYTSDVAGEAMITNKGDLTISGDGNIVYTYTGEADSAYTKGNYTITNSGKLTIDGAVVENATAAMKHAFYTVNNSNGGQIVMEDGLILNTNNYAVRMFGDGALTVNGGEIKGTRAVWMQAPGSDTTVSPTIALTVNGGKLTATGESATYRLAVYSYSYGNSLENVSVTVTDGVIDGDIALSGGKNKTVAETVTVTGGTITDLYSYAADEVAGETINVSGGTFANEIAAVYCASGFATEENEDGTYGIVAALPEVVITDIKGSLTDSDPDMTFALNFAIKDLEDLTDEYLEALMATYGSHYVDYVLTISGLTDESVTFNANGGADGYLGGQYDAWSANWVCVPFEDVTMKNGESLYIMEYAAKLMGQSGLRYTLAEVAAIVQNFDCGVYFTPEFLNANPNMVVTLELKVFTEDAAGNKIEDISVATNEFKNEYEAIVVATNKQTHYFTTLEAAVAAAEEGETVILLAPAVIEAGETLTLDKDITVTYTSDVAGEDMITNKGNLVIDGATVVYTNTDTTASNVTVSTISCEPGSVLTVNSGVVKNDSANNAASGIYAYAIDLLTNGSLGDVTATINGGEIISTNYMAIRQFNNGEACENTLEVTGGYIYGAKRAIQVHLKNNAAHTTITGGTVEGGEYALCFLTTSENLSVEGGTFKGSVWYSGTDGFISGGIFDKPVAEAYCAEGYIPTENADGTYGVKKGAYVAQIGDIRYESLAEAVAAAAEGNTIILLTNVSAAEVTVIDKTVTLDLNGKTVENTGTGWVLKIDGNSTVTLVDNSAEQTGTVKGAKGINVVQGSKLIMESGNITASGSTGAAIQVYGSEAVVNGGTVTAAYGAVLIYSNNDVRGTFTMNGGKLSSAAPAIYANGSEAYDNVDVTINGGEIVGEDIAIFWPAAGKLTINGGSITGATAVYVKSGSLEITGGTLTANGEKKDYAYKTSGAVTTGDALVIENVGGTSGYEAVEAVSITGGTFTSANAAAVASYAADNATAVSEFIIGGTYSSDVTDYCVTGFVAEENEDGTYGIVAALPEVVITDIKDSLTDSDPDMTFALNFAIKDLEDLTDEYLEALMATYGSHYVDYVLTISGLTDESVTFNANGGADGYLGGQYDAWSANWVCVPFEDVTMANGDSLYIMEYAAKLMGQSGLRYTLAEVAAIVQNFDCGVYFTPEFLNANPNMVVTLELKVFTEDAEGNKIEDISVATNEFKNEYEAIVVDTNKQTHYFTTLEAAVAAAEAGETVILLEDAQIDELIKIEKAITLDLYGNTVTATSKKAFEVYANATIENGTIKAVNRCVDTRTAVALTLTDVTLIADEYTSAYANPQPLTIGGSDNGTTVTMENVTIEAGQTGYGIITFVETDLTATNCDISGYMALYVKAGSENSEFTFTDSTLTGDNSKNDVAGNTTAAIQTEANDVTVNVTGGTVNVPGNNAAAIVIVDGVTGTTVTVDAAISGNILLTDDVENNTITVREAYTTKLTEEGYMYETAATAGMVTVTAKAVAFVEGTLFDDLMDAIDAAEEIGTATVVVLADIELKSHVVITEGITLDLNGCNVTTTKTFTVYGDVIDGTVGGYGSISASKVHISGERSFLPIYDSAAEAYRFYDYQLVNLGGKAAGENAVKFGIRLLLTNQDGYAVLANTTDAKLSVHALITWDSLGNDIDYTFLTTTVQSYAQQVAAQVSAGQSITKAIVLTVTGLDKLPEGDIIKMTPELQSETKMTATGTQVEWAGANA